MEDEIAQPPAVAGAGSSSDAAPHHEEAAEPNTKVFLPGPPPVFCGSRPVKSPHLQREDVGSYGILVGNWGGIRHNNALQTHIDNDLKSGPASIIILQEAQPQVMEILQAPAVAAVMGADGKVLQRPCY